MHEALSRHWPEYLMEAAGLGLFMLSACLCATLLEPPGSALHHILPDPLLRRLLMGLAMGLTAVGIIYSPWGQQSGAHINPAVTLSFWYLGKIEHWDAVFYVLAQCLGAAAGVWLAALVLGQALAAPPVSYITTLPGMAGTAVAFAVELMISTGLMGMVLITSNRTTLAPYTGLFAGGLVAFYITVFAPYSGMSMNPARSLGSALMAGQWQSLWIYLTAPPLGMFLAAEIYHRVQGPHAVKCCKLHHENNRRCIFRCNYQRTARGQAQAVMGE